ncbi:MAG: C69 family dipeptidase, partial [Bacteroidales bacterium]|nr:C69 family dipeptidase [Bacteroidales bacterium]
NYGYVSEGESFSVVDKDEAWIFEVIGKGKGQKGAVWVARLIPDGYVCAHANQARITTFPLASKKCKTSITYKDINKLSADKNINCVYSDDVITFARSKGYFKGLDEEFSFSDTYNPVDFSGARFCEIRVWAFFNDVCEGMDKYWDYAKGVDIKYDANGYATNRMPLWVKPSKPVELETVMRNMGNHLEGTELDMSKGLGAGPFNCPYRWRPMTWDYNGKSYIHERATGTQQTGFSFVAQLRGNLPDVIGAINWFGVDDCATTVYVPMFASIVEVPYAYREGNGSIMNFSADAAFWIFNLVSNYAYTRYCDIFPEIQSVRKKLHEEFKNEIAKMDSDLKAEALSNPQDVSKKLTEFSAMASEKTMKTWTKLFTDLFVKYMDGNIKTERQVPENYKYYSPEVKQPKYGNDWYKHIVEDDTNKLLEAK